MKREREKGQALVETALAMPVFLAMFLAIFAFGYLFSVQQVVTNACREGARVGTLGKSETEIKQAIQQYLNAADLNSPSLIAVQGAGSMSGSSVSVQVSYPLSLSLPVPGLPEAIPLSARTVMRIE